MIKQEKLSELTQTDFKWFDVVDIDEADIRELKNHLNLLPRSLHMYLT